MGGIDRAASMPLLDQPRLLVAEVQVALSQRGLVVGEVGLLDQGVELNELGTLLHVITAAEEVNR